MYIKQICLIFCIFFIVITLNICHAGNSLIKSCEEDTLGGIAINGNLSKVWTILGSPDEKSVIDKNRSAFSIDELYYTYKNGIHIMFTKKNNNWSVFRISIEYPCKLATSKGVKIGDTESKVKENYILKNYVPHGNLKLINDEFSSLANQTLYCGDNWYDALIAFTFDKEGKVKKIEFGILND